MLLFDVKWFYCLFLSFLLSLMKDIQKPFLQPPQSCTLSVQHSIRVLSSFFTIINAIETKSYKGLQLRHLQSISDRWCKGKCVPPFSPCCTSLLSYHFLLPWQYSHFPLHFTSRWVEILFSRSLAVRCF